MKAPLFPAALGPDYPQSRLGVEEMLHLFLADEYVFYVTTRDHRGKPVPPAPAPGRASFESRYAAIASGIDRISSRIRRLGVAARSNWTELHEAADNSNDPGVGAAAEHVLASLLKLHAELVTQLRRDIAASAQRGDTRTADFLVRLLADHESATGALQAHVLGSALPATTQPFPSVVPLS